MKVIYIHQNIKFLRSLKAINQKDLGSMLGVGQSQIGRYETDILPPTKAVLFLSSHFQVSLDDLFFKDLSATGNLSQEPEESYLTSVLARLELRIVALEKEVDRLKDLTKNLPE